MSDNTPAVDESGGNEQEAAFSRLIAGIHEKANKEATETVVDMLTNAGLGETDRSRAPDAPEGAPVVRATPGIEYKQPAFHARYAKLPEWQRAVRSPEGDMVATNWLRALARGDRTTLMEIAAKDKLARATLEVSPFDGGGLGVATGTAGALVPIQLANAIVTILQRRARMRAIAAVQSASSASMHWPVQNSTTSVAWEGESDQIAQSEPDYIRKVFILKKQANMSVVSNEALDDAAFDLVSLVSQDVGMSFAADEDLQFATSDGTGALPTEGLQAADLAAAAVTPGAAGVLTYADLVKLFFAVGDPYRQGAVWVCNDLVLQLLSNLRDGANSGSGRSLLQMHDNPGNVVSDNPGAVGSIFGRPVYSLPLDENTDAGTATPNTNRLYFGDMRRTYGILDGGGMRAAVSTERYFEFDQVAYRWTRRMDGRTLLAITHGAYAFLDDMRSVG